MNIEHRGCRMDAAIVDGTISNVREGQTPQQCTEAIGGTPCRALVSIVFSPERGRYDAVNVATEGTTHACQAREAMAADMLKGDERLAAILGQYPDEDDI